MKIVTGLDQLVAAYCAEKIGIDVTRNTPFTALAVKDSDDNFCAGIIISNWRGVDCEISMAAETASWARRGVLTTVFRHVFETMGCVRLTCIVANKKSTRRTQKFLRGLNFHLEGNMRRGYDGTVGALIFGLLREDCRFLGGFKDGQENRSCAASGSGPDCDGSGADAIEQRDGYRECEPQPDRPVLAVG